MSLPVAMVRTLVVLLIVRMIAAPLALRPDSPPIPSHDHFVARVCAWPAPSPERTPSISAALRLSVGNGPGAIDDQAFRRLCFNPLTQAVLSLLGRHVALDSSTAPLVGCLRC